MKFGTLLELNSNFEWFDKYVDYDGLKKLFPNEPFDPSYHRGRPGAGRDEEEGSPLLQAGDERGGATQEEFIAACDRERNKVIEFYKEKEQELTEDFRSMQHEIKLLEDRELEDVIEEEDEEEEDGQEDLEHDNQADSNSHPGRPAGLITNGPSHSRLPEAARRLSHDDQRLIDVEGAPSSPPGNNNAAATGFFKRFGAFGRSSSDTKDETDLLEAALSPAVLQQSQLGGRNMSGNPRSRSRSVHPASPSKNGSNTGPSPKFKRSVSDYELPSPGMPPTTREHRLSVSSASSGGGAGHGYRFRGNLGLIPMDNTGLADSMISASSAQGGTSNLGSFIWTANSDYGKVVRIGFKKRIAALWLEGHSLGQYTDLNMTAFEKILKKSVFLGPGCTGRSRYSLLPLSPTVFFRQIRQKHQL